MSISTVQSTPVIPQTQSTAPGRPVAPAPATKQDTPALTQDKVDIKSGVWPSLKGAGVGLLSSGVATMGTVIVWDKVAHLGSGALALLAIPMVGVPAGTIAGAVTANVTDDKLKGTLLGAGIGAASGAIQAGATMKTIQAALVGAGIGAVSGAIGGFTGSLTAQRK